MEITKVGRRWLYLGEGREAMRIDKVTLDGCEENFYRCYESKEAWLESTFRADAWALLKSDVWGAMPPDTLSLEDIQLFHKKLRGEDA